MFLAASHNTLKTIYNRNAAKCKLVIYEHNYNCQIFKKKDWKIISKPPEGFQFIKCLICHENCTFIAKRRRKPSRIFHGGTEVICPKAGQKHAVYRFTSAAEAGMMIKLLKITHLAKNR